MSDHDGHEYVRELRAQIAELEAQRESALALANERCAAALARAEAATRGYREADNERRSLKVRVESQAAALSAANARAESEAATLRAENERLRAELAQLASNYATAAAVHIVDQRELAAANALPAGIRALTRWDTQPAEPEEDDDGPLYQGMLTSAAGQFVRWEDLEAHLARQPAAPVFPGVRCERHDAALANLAYFMCGCRYVQPPAPTRTERVTFTTVQGQTLSSCTMADVEVLKEADAVPTRTLQNEHPLSDWAGLAKAELARRELKP